MDFSDDGSGVPASEKELIFWSFTRLPPHSFGRPEPRGAGLGLAICREVMERRGVSVIYLLGQGRAAVRVTIPRGLAAAAE